VGQPAVGNSLYFHMEETESVTNYCAGAGLNPPLAVVSALFSQEQYADLCSWQAALSNALVYLTLSRQTYPGCISTRVS